VKNYSSNRAQKGKTAYRTPSLYKANKSMHVADVRARVLNGQMKAWKKDGFMGMGK